MSIAPRAGCMKRTSGSGMKLKRVFDIHAHIYPDAIASHAVRAISEAYDAYPLAVKLHLADLTATYLMEKGTGAHR